MKKEIALSRRKDIQSLQDLLIDNADGENIEGDGKNIVHSKNFPLKHTFICALEDSIFVNVHKNPDNIKDIKKLEDEIVSLTFEDYEKYIKKNK